MNRFLLSRFPLNKFSFLKIILISLALLSQHSYAQERPFWSEIQHFKKLDKIAKPAKRGIVFVGSSSLRLWTNLEKQYKAYQVINRGFGGSDLIQANAYIDELVLTYQPRQVVIYSGENDIAAGASADETFKRFVTFFGNLRHNLPRAPIDYISIKLSPSRMEFAGEMIKANDMIKAYLKKQRNAHFIEVNEKMLNADGGPRPELFQKDMLHMKPAGYAIWTKEITPYLTKK